MAFIRRIADCCLRVGLSAVIGLVAMPGGWAQVGYSLYPSSTQASSTDMPPSQPPLSLTAINETRTENSVVLYTDDFGTSTRTNALGTEVVATLATTSSGTPLNPNGGQTYVVKAVISQADCEKSGQASLCGNASIPKSGIVLSASGSAQKALLGQLTVGQTFELVPRWFQTRTQFVDAVNPTPETNPRGKTYPGLRASQQLLIYDQGYGQPTTGTNEFGFEVTVTNGLVTAQEGANSTIPPSGFVLSAHGKNRDWLVENAPLGAQIAVEDVTDKPYPQKITSAVTPSTYRYRLLKGVQAADALLPAKDLAVYQAKLGQVDVLMQDGKDTQAAQLAHHSLEDLNHHLWAALPGFDATAVRGVWHRPVETTASAIGQTLDALKAAGINTVFLETYYHGMTIFPSETMAAYGLPTQYPKYVGLDQLKTWIDLAHAREMKVHAWTQDFYCGNLQTGNGGGPILKKYPGWVNVQKSALKPVKVVRKIPVPVEVIELNQKEVDPATTDANHDAAAAKPAETETTVEEWVFPPETQPIVSSTLEKGGFFLDPANPDAKAFVKKLLLEMATRYPLDGIQLDYIRYPASFPPDRYSYVATTWGYTPLARKAFAEQAGVDPVTLDPKVQPDLWQEWNAYKRDQVTGFVADVSAAIHQANPKIQLTAAVFAGTVEAGIQKHQDWRTWVNQGYLDGLAPMTLTSAPKVIAADVKQVLDATQRKVPVYPGLFGAFNNNSAEQLLEQIATAKTNGANGFVLFETAHLTGRQYKALAVANKAKPETLSPAPKPTEPIAPVKKKRKRWFFGLF